MGLGAKLSGLAAFIGTTLVAALLASPAPAMPIRDDAADPPVFRAAGGGLTAAERKALDIVSVRAVSSDPIGLVVTVTFAGNIERALGRGHLKRALVAMILEPKDASLAAAGLMTRGPGAIGETLRHTRSTDVGVLRHGRQLYFFVRGPGSEDVGRIVIKAFAARPRSTSAELGSVARPNKRPEPVSIALWNSIVREISWDQDSITRWRRINYPEAAPCVDLPYLIREARKLVADAEKRRDELLELQKKITAAIDLVVSDYQNPLPQAVSTAVDVLAAPLHLFLDVESLEELFIDIKALLYALKSDASQVKSLIARNGSLLVSARFFLSDATNALALCQSGATTPPEDVEPIVGAIGADFTQEDRQTTYSLTKAQAPEGVTLTYSWTLLVPANDPTCNNRGVLTSTDREFDWYHGDDVCDHAREDPILGHLGTVQVVVRNGFGWECTAVYVGTTDGVGPKADCVRR